MERRSCWNCSPEMKLKLPANRSMPPQPASKEGGTMLHSDSFMIRLRATNDPPEKAPRR